MGISTAILLIYPSLSPKLVLGGPHPRSQLSLCLVTLLVWFAKSSPQSPPRKPKEKQVKENILKVKMSGLSLSLAASSLLFYTSMTWLPTMAVSAGISNSDAALPPFYFLTDQHSFFDDCFQVWPLVCQMVIVESCWQLSLSFGMMGIAMLLYPANNFLYWLVVHLFSWNGLQCPLPLPHGLLLLLNQFSWKRQLSYQD